MTTSSTADRVLAELQAYGLKQQSPGTYPAKYRCDSPLRPGSNSAAFTLQIISPEHGVWFDHVSGERGSLYTLATKLNISTPTPRRTAGTPASTVTKRAYTDFADYAQGHGVPVDAFRALGWNETRHDGRPALAWPTETGTRHRFLDGNSPVFKSPAGYRACWYGLTEAVLVATITGQPLVLCNGEPSVVGALYHGVAAACITGGGERTLPQPLLDTLRAMYRGPILVALDCDQKGRGGALDQVMQLRAAGATARAVDLGGSDGFDLGGFCAAHGDGSADALGGLPDLPLPPWLLTEDQLDALPPPTYLIEGKIVVGEVTVLNGASDAGKTFLILDAANRVSKFYKVIYVAGEDVRGIRLRKAAWLTHYNLPKTGNFITRTEPLNLYTGGPELEEFIVWTRFLGAKLVVIDTLSQCITGADENSAQHMGQAMANAQKIAHETGAAVVILHHTTKDGLTYRGSGTIKANSYGLLNVSNDDGTIKLECGRIKNSPGFKSLFFRLVPVMVSGEQSCVPLPAHAVPASKDLTTQQLKVLEALALRTDSVGGCKASDLEGAAGVPHAGFYRALKELRTRGCVDQDKSTLKISQHGRTELARASQDPALRGDDALFNVASADALPEAFIVNPNLVSKPHDTSADTDPEIDPDTSPEPGSGSPEVSSDDPHQDAKVSKYQTGIDEVSDTPVSDQVSSIGISPPFRGDTEIPETSIEDQDDPDDPGVPLTQIHPKSVAFSAGRAQDLIDNGMSRADAIDVAAAEARAAAIQSEEAT